MFKACFVAKVDPAEVSCRIFCQFRNEELGTTASLPSAQHLGSFCFPLGPENVHPKEYGATEVSRFSKYGARSPRSLPVCTTDWMRHLVSAGVLLHFDWWGWEPLTRLLQVEHHIDICCGNFRHRKPVRLVNSSVPCAGASCPRECRAALQERTQTCDTRKCCALSVRSHGFRSTTR